MIVIYLASSAEQKKLRIKLDDWTGLLLFMIATAMLVFSGYLMYLLAFEIRAVCIYCVASALFAEHYLSYRSSVESGKMSDN